MSFAGTDNDDARRFLAPDVTLSGDAVAGPGGRRSSLRVDVRENPDQGFFAGGGALPVAGGALATGGFGS